MGTFEKLAAIIQTVRAIKENEPNVTVDRNFVADLTDNPRLKNGDADITLPTVVMSELLRIPEMLAREQADIDRRKKEKAK